MQEVPSSQIHKDENNPWRVNNWNSALVGAYSYCWGGAVTTHYLSGPEDENHTQAVS